MSNEVLPEPLVNEVDVQGLPPGDAPNDTLQWTGANWTVAAGGGGAAIVSRSVFVSQELGDDDTGERGNLAKPYATLLAAATAASAGDTIYVFPSEDPYVVNQNIHRPYVSWNFAPGTYVLVTVVAFQAEVEVPDSIHVAGAAEFILDAAGAMVYSPECSVYFQCARITGAANQELFHLSTLEANSITLNIDEITVNMGESNEAAMYFYNIVKAVVNVTKFRLEGQGTCISTEAVEDPSSDVVVNVPYLSGETAIKAAMGTFNCNTENCNVGVQLMGYINKPIILNGSFTSVIDRLDGGSDARVLLTGYADAISLYGPHTTLTGGMARIIDVYGGKVTGVIFGARAEGSPLLMRTRVDEGSSNDCIVDVTLDNVGICPEVHVSFGTVTIRGTSATPMQQGEGTGIDLQSGVLHLIGLYKLDNMDHFIQVAGGNLFLDGCTIHMASAEPNWHNIAIKQTGGLIHARGAILTTARDRTKALAVTQFLDGAPSLIVYPSGLLISSDTAPTLQAQAQIAKVQITSIAQPVTITLFAGEGNQSFTEADLEFYNSIPAMAQRMAELMNGALTCTTSYIADSDSFYIFCDGLEPELFWGGMQGCVTYGYAPKSYAPVDVFGEPMGQVYESFVFAT